MSRQDFSIDYHYDVIFTEGVFEKDNQTFFDLLQHSSERIPTRIALAIDEGCLKHHPSLLNDINKYCDSFDELTLAAEPLVLPGGEAVKNDFNLVLNTLTYIDQAKIDRHSYLIAIGGGAILDMVGFVAAIGHRGIRHIRIPTTVLSQNDSGVGVKNGVNFGGKKNFIGTFAPPVAVINDRNFLPTLNDRDWRSGIPEAIKVSLLKDTKFYNWIENNVANLNNRDLDTMMELVERCAVLHMDHIRNNGDPFEKGSSRPLDFGHWAAHKLEQLTDFDIRHGEAVAIGLAIDNIYAWKMGLLSENDCIRIVDCLQKLEFDLYHPALMTKDEATINPQLTSGLEEFREHLGGELTIMLLSGIGKPIEVHQMDTSIIAEAVIYIKNSFKHVYANKK